MKKIKIYGLGGQGVVTMGKVLCTAYSIYESKFAKTMPAYGHERKGGAVLTDVISDEAPILTNSFISVPDCVIVLAPKAQAEELHLPVTSASTSILILNTSEPNQEYVSSFSKCWYVDATDISVKYCGKNLPNIGMMGALAKSGMIQIEAVQNAISDFFGVKAELYQKILMEAYNDTKEK